MLYYNVHHTNAKEINYIYRTPWTIGDKGKMSELRIPQNLVEAGTE